MVKLRMMAVLDNGPSRFGRFISEVAMVQIFSMLSRSNLVLERVGNEIQPAS